MLDLLLGGARRRFLDGRSDVAAAYSLLRLGSGYRGPLVRVRRSADNLEADFGVGRGDVDWGQLAGFVGAGSGFVSRWYDQGGNGRDFTQTTAAQQPKMILAANGMPALLFDGVSSFMTTAAFALNQPWSFNICYRQVADGTSFSNVIDGLLPGDIGTFFWALNNYDAGMFANGFGTTASRNTSMPQGVRGVVGGTFNGSAYLMEVNAQTVTSYGPTVGGTASAGGLSIGSRADQAAARFANMEVHELLAFATAHTSPQLRDDNAARRIKWRF